MDAVSRGCLANWRFGSGDEDLEFGGMTGGELSLKIPTGSRAALR